eukprot:m51a1_g1745 putative tectonin beta-propeller repeat-containing protein 1 (274) ;mRNA; r:194599-197174
MRGALLLFAAVLSVTADDNYWTSVPGLKAQNLEADAAGNLWAVNSETGSMWFLGVSQGSWTLVDEISIFTQVSVNDVGVVWAIGGTEQEPTTLHVLRRVGITPQRLTGTGWETVPGAMVQLSVGPRGNVVALDSQGNIYFRKGVTSANPSGSSWQKYEGRLTQVSYSNNGQIWGTASVDRTVKIPGPFLRFRYEDGKDVTLGKAKAVWLFRAAGDLGHTTASYNYARMVRCCEGINATAAEAAATMKRAMLMGSTDAMKCLGVMALRGEGIAK